MMVKPLKDDMDRHPDRANKWEISITQYFSRRMTVYELNLLNTNLHKT